MARKTHPIKKFNYRFSARSTIPDLSLYGDRWSLRASVRFVDDSSPIAAPIISPDLNSARVCFKKSSQSGLIKMLRSGRSVNVTIDEQNLVLIHTTLGLIDSLVVCSSSAEELVDAKIRGIREAMKRMVDFCGADLLPELCPITFHLDGDSYCGPYQSGFTGRFTIDSSGQGHVCLWDVEKENRFHPFTVENAEKIEDQLLPVHEAMHGWFLRRQNTYKIQEPFCHWVSYVISELPGGPEYCHRFESTPDNHPNVLMKYLCPLGLTTQRVSQILKQLAESASQMSMALSNAEFAGIVSNVLGQDAVPAFQSAGLLP